MENNELQHYGVVGMKWGVRRASKQLSKATTSESRKAAIDKLQKHRSKGAAKIDKLNKKGVQLEKQAEKQIIKKENYGSELMRQSSAIRNKAYGRFTSRDKAAKRVYKADKLQARAQALLSDVDAAKAKVHKNKAIVSAFQREINNIDDVLLKAGKKYLSK